MVLTVIGWLFMDTDYANNSGLFKGFLSDTDCDGFKLDIYCLGMRSRGFSKLFLSRLLYSLIALQMSTQICFDSNK